MSRRLLQPADLGSLSASAPDLAQVFVSLASDIALVVDAEGMVLNVAQDTGEPLGQLAESWVGKRWVDTVTHPTRSKIERLLADVAGNGLGRRREVNHDGGAAGDLPVSYTALRLGQHGPVLAVGRDLRGVSAIQQRFVQSQQDVERNYWVNRQNDTRHRLLQHVATDAMMTVALETLRVVDSNAAATLLLRREYWPLAGCEIEQQFDANSRQMVRDLLLHVATSGRAAEAHVRVAGTHVSVGLRVLLIRSAAGPRLLLRARTAEPLMYDAYPLGQALMRLIQATRDSVVATDERGRITAANRAFQRLVQVSDEESLLGRPLADWIDDAAAQTLVQGAQEQGIIHTLGLAIRRADGSRQVANASATLLAERDRAGAGLILQPVLQENGSGP